MNLALHLLCFFYVLALFSGTLFADDFFDEVDVEIEISPEETNKIQVSGFMRQKISYGLDSPEEKYGFERTESALSQVQTDFFTELSASIKENLQWKISAKYQIDWLQWLNSESYYQVNNTHFILRDAYLDYVKENGLWVKAGHQILAWGESEGLVISDVLNPRDLQEPGQSELRDIREQIPALSISYPVKQTKLSFVSTYAAGHNRTASKGEEFYPYWSAQINDRTVSIIDPEDNWETAVKAEHQFNGGDLSFLLADVNDNQLVFFGLDEMQQQVFRQERIQVFAMSYSQVKDSLLFKFELGMHWGRPVYGNLDGSVIYQNQWRSMFAVEYANSNQWRFNLEINNQYSDDIGGDSFSNELKQSEFGGVFRLRKTSFNERLTNQWLVTQVTAGKSNILRWDLIWQCSDSVEFGAKFVLYDSRNKASNFYPYRKHDIFEASLTAYF